MSKRVRITQTLLGIQAGTGHLVKVPAGTVGVHCGPYPGTGADLIAFDREDGRPVRCLAYQAWQREDTL